MIDSKFYIGIVEDRNDPEQLGRVRVRIFGMHTDSKALIPTADLPLATVVQPTTSSAFSGVGMTPKIIEGSTVIVIFADGDDNLQYPVILGTISGYNETYYKIIDGQEIGRNRDMGFNDPNGQYPLPGYIEQSDLPKLARSNADIEFNRPLLSTYLFDEPNSGMGNNVYPYNQVRQSESGHFEEWDDTPGNARINMQHRAGTYREINNTGQRILKVVSDKFDIIIKDDNVFIGGKHSKIVQGDETDFVNGKWDVTVGGNVNVNVIGDANINSNGSINLNSGRDINLNAADNINIRSGGSMDIGSSSSVSITAGGSLTGNSRGSTRFNAGGSFGARAAGFNWSIGGASVNAPSSPSSPNISKPPLVQTIERPLLPAELEYINQFRDQYIYDSDLRTLGVNYPPPPPADSDRQYFMPQRPMGTWADLNAFLTARFNESQSGSWDETGANPRILTCYKEVGFNINNDDVPWCAAFAGYALKASGFAYLAAPKSGLSSLAYRGYGQSVDVNSPESWRKWDMVVFSRKGGGHIGFIYGVNREQGRVIVLGGNQSNSLRLSSFPLRGETFPLVYIGRNWMPPEQQIFTTASVASITRVV